MQQIHTKTLFQPSFCMTASSSSSKDLTVEKDWSHCGSARRTLLSFLLVCKHQEQPLVVVHQRAATCRCVTSKTAAICTARYVWVLQRCRVRKQVVDSHCDIAPDSGSASGTSSLLERSSRDEPLMWWLSSGPCASSNINRSRFYTLSIHHGKWRLRCRCPLQLDNPRLGCLTFMQPGRPAHQPLQQLLRALAPLHLDDGGNGTRVPCELLIAPLCPQQAVQAVCGPTRTSHIDVAMCPLLLMRIPDHIIRSDVLERRTNFASPCVCAPTRQTA